MNKVATFETAYTRYPFAPLVTLGLAISAWLKGTAKAAGTKNAAKGRNTVSGAIGHAV